MDSLQIQKQLMVEQLNKLEYLDKIMPLHKDEVQQDKKLQVQMNSLNFQRIINGQENNKLIEEIEESKLDAQKSRHKQLQKYFTSFMTQQDVNILEFNQTDFEVFQQIKEKQRQLAYEDLTIARQKEKTNQIFEQNLMKKWDRVRKKLRMIGRMKRLYDEVKLYGTSCRVETSIKRHEVIQELEQMLNKQNEQISKPMPQKHSKGIPLSRTLIPS